MAGLTIALEGIDGSGKSTQADRLEAWLGEHRKGAPVVRVREPGGTELGEAVRELLLRGGDMGAMAEMLLYMACRAELYERTIEPTLARDGVVLLDRSYYSTVAYQGAGLGLDPERILELSAFVTGDRAPDRVVLLRMPPEQAARRLAVAANETDRIEARDIDYFRRVEAGYEALLSGEPERFRAVDGEASPDAVFAAILEALDDVL